MNEVLKTIAERYTCRDFFPEPLDGTQIEFLTNAALASPSAMNLQPWRIIVLTDKNLIDEMDAAAMEHVKKDVDWYARMKERGGKIFYNAPCIIYIAKDASDYATLDCGIVAQNITLAAHSLGLGSCICAMARIPLGGDKDEDFLSSVQHIPTGGKKAPYFLSRLNFPEGFTFGTAVLVGKVKTAKPPHETDKSKISLIP